MMIANPNDANHTFKFIPKGTDVNSVVISNVLDNTVYSFTKSKIFKDKYFYVLLNATMALTLNDTLSFQAFDSNDNLIFHDVIFCTDQVISDYTINKDVYIEKVTENKFILNEQ